MTNGTTPTATSKATRRVVAYRTAGLAACGAGLVVGAVMIARRREVTCPDGTYFPSNETDFRCFAHPQALGGYAVVLICLAMAVVVALCATAAMGVVARSDD